MKRIYRIEELDCANCAAKMEREINRIDGVNEAVISFMTQKLTIDADDNRFDEILKKAQKVCKKIESGAKIIF